MGEWVIANIMWLVPHYAFSKEVQIYRENGTAEKTYTVYMSPTSSGI